jgi:hypothetical protein
MDTLFARREGLLFLLTLEIGQLLHRLMDNVQGLFNFFLRND